MKSKLSRRLRIRLRAWLFAVLLFTVAVSLYARVSGGHVQFAAPFGAILGALIAGFEIFFVQAPAGARLRRMPAPLYIAIVSAVWALLIFLALELLFRFVQSRGLELPAGSVQTRMLRAAIFAFTVALLLNFALRLRTLVGTRVLLNFLLGRYHRPVREERVFMFLDLAGSTALSERLGDERAQEFIASFFFDIAAPVVEYGGETHRYIGDEVVVTWPLSEVRDDARCLCCVAAIMRLLEDRAAFYEHEFGCAPRFRVGLHCGPVVASEVGDDKREIVYFGDTVNTAARIASFCRDAQRDWLVSGDLLEHLVLPGGIAAEPLGEHNLRGKHRALALYALTPGD